MAKNPRNYPDTIPSAESGRPMTRGEKLVTFKDEGKAFTYKQPGWWCSLTDPDDMEGQLVDDDNQVADMARRTAKALAHEGIRSGRNPRHSPTLRPDATRSRSCVRQGRKVV